MMKKANLKLFILLVNIIVSISYADTVPTKSSEVDLIPIEGNANHTTYFLLEIGSPLTFDVSVDYTTRDNTAIAEEDYISISGVATIVAGETHTPIGVKIIGDSIIESSETFTLAISNPQGATFPLGITEITAKKTIVDDDSDILTLDPYVLPYTSGDWYKPNLSISWQWQLIGVVNTSYLVNIYDIDLFDSSEELINSLKIAGKTVICYFSAGSYENFRSDIDKFNSSVLGNIMDGWPDEQWLDIRSENVVNVMIDRLDLAVQKGCDGVEPDNMDGYINNSGFDLSTNDQLAFNKLIANESHKRGLSVGLKNDLDQIPQLVNFFDFAVNEQCNEFDECDTLSPFINANKPVLNAEYLDKYATNSNERSTLCETTNNLQFSTLVLPLDLDDSFRYSCL